MHHEIQSTNTSALCDVPISQTLSLQTTLLMPFRQTGTGKISRKSAGFAEKRLFLRSARHRLG